MVYVPGARRVVLSLLIALTVVCLPGLAEEPSWGLARSAHFEVYSQAGKDSARSGLLFFEQLRLFFEQQTTLQLHGRMAVRVVGFQSDKAYDPYRLSSTADAYYVGSETRDYIILPSLSSDRLSAAAHEYAHVMMHAGGLHLPSWLNEGLAEVLSTVQVGADVTTVGGDLPARSQALRKHRWIPVDAILNAQTSSPLRESRHENELFYAESWALTDMLAFSPAYAGGLQQLITSLSSGNPSTEVFHAVYGKSIAAITLDLQSWVDGHRRVPFKLPGVAPERTALTLTEVPQGASRAVLAELFLTNGDLGKAKKLYTELASQPASNGDALGALALIRLMGHDYDGASAQWQHAEEQQVNDAALCYKFARFAEDAHMPSGQIRSALERAIAIEPAFDDAHYKLALLERGAGQHEEALGHLHAMKTVAPARSFGYWLAIASSEEELGHHDEAATAAEKAKAHASTEHEQLVASQMVLVAKTDLVVQFTRDARGQQQVATTRISRKKTDWNPFVEPEDRVRKLMGTLQEVECTSSAIRLVLTTNEGVLRLAIPDPTRVQIQGGPTQFECGRQNEIRVMVEYALPAKPLDGSLPLLRGLTFTELAAVNPIH